MGGRGGGFNRKGGRAREREERALGSGGREGREGREGGEAAAPRIPRPKRGGRTGTAAGAPRRAGAAAGASASPVASPRAFASVSRPDRLPGRTGPAAPVRTHWRPGATGFGPAAPSPRPSSLKVHAPERMEFLPTFTESLNSLASSNQAEQPQRPPLRIGSFGARACAFGNWPVRVGPLPPDREGHQAVSHQGRKMREQAASWRFRRHSRIRKRIKTTPKKTARLVFQKPSTALAVPFPLDPL